MGSVAQRASARDHGWAARYRLPTFGMNDLFPRDGGLMSYSIDSVDTYRQGASYTTSYAPGELIPCPLSGSIPELPHVAKGRRLGLPELESELRLFDGSGPVNTSNATRYLTLQTPRLTAAAGRSRQPTKILPDRCHDELELSAARP